MRFFEDPNFVTVHEDSASCCNRCNSEVKPPVTYAEAKKFN